jgi:hypothetical protein
MHAIQSTPEGMEFLHNANFTRFQDGGLSCVKQSTVADIPGRSAQRWRWGHGPWQASCVNQIGPRSSSTNSISSHSSRQTLGWGKMLGGLYDKLPPCRRRRSGCARPKPPLPPSLLPPLLPLNQPRHLLSARVRCNPRWFRKRCGRVLDLPGQDHKWRNGDDGYTSIADHTSRRRQVGIAARRLEIGRVSSWKLGSEVGGYPTEPPSKQIDAGSEPAAAGLARRYDLDVCPHHQASADPGRPGQQLLG